METNTARNRLDDMLERYGEVCTQKVAAQLLSVVPRTIHRMLEEGQSNEQIIDFLVSRYGDFVLYKPPVTARTLLLWYGPAGLLAGGFVLLGVILLRRRSKAGVVASGLSVDEQQRLTALLNQTPVDKKD